MRLFDRSGWTRGVAVSGANPAVFMLDGLRLRNNAGTLEKPADGSSWSAVRRTMAELTDNDRLLNFAQNGRRWRRADTVSGHRRPIRKWFRMLQYCTQILCPDKPRRLTIYQAARSIVQDRTIVSDALRVLTATGYLHLCGREKKGVGLYMIAVVRNGSLVDDGMASRIDSAGEAA